MAERNVFTMALQALLAVIALCVVAILIALLSFRTKLSWLRITASVILYATLGASIYCAIVTVLLLCAALFVYSKVSDVEPYKSDIVQALGARTILSLAFISYFAGVGSKWLLENRNIHQGIAKSILRTAFKQVVPTALPLAPNNNANVLAYRALYVENFSTCNLGTID